MVGSFRRSVLAYLRALHQQSRARGLEGQNPRTTVYRWHRQLGGRLHYYPNVPFSAFGMVHVHAFITNAGEHWYSFPFAIERAWTTNHPGRRILYLHCIIPNSVHADELFREHRRRGETVWTVTTGDGWQSLSDLARILDHHGRMTPRAALEHERSPAWRGTTNLSSQYPLAIPVLSELLLERRSLPTVWRAIHERLGNDVWRYLPPRTRRVVHNGKRYVNEVLRLLNAEGLVRQHIIKYTPLREHHLEIILVTRTAETLAAVAKHSPVIETYSSSDGRHLVLATGGVQLLKTVITSGARWWVIDEQRTDHAPRVRLLYEKVFAATGWCTS